MILQSVTLSRRRFNQPLNNTYEPLWKKELYSTIRKLSLMIFLIYKSSDTIDPKFHIPLQLHVLIADARANDARTDTPPLTT